jgi:hypothetical protein
MKENYMMKKVSKAKIKRAERIATLARDLEALTDCLNDLDGGREFNIKSVRYNSTYGSSGASVGAFDHLTKEDREAINKYVAGKLRARKRAMEAELTSL